MPCNGWWTYHELLFGRWTAGPLSGDCGLLVACIKTGTKLMFSCTK